MYTLKIFFLFFLYRWNDVENINPVTHHAGCTSNTWCDENKKDIDHYNTHCMSFTKSLFFFSPAYTLYTLYTCRIIWVHSAIYLYLYGQCDALYRVIVHVYIKLPLFFTITYNFYILIYLTRGLFFSLALFIFSAKLLRGWASILYNHFYNYLYNVEDWPYILYICMLYSVEPMRCDNQFFSVYKRVTALDQRSYTLLFTLILYFSRIYI